MSRNGSTGVVYAALAGNLAIAGIKLGASLFTDSSAMLTEAIHSFVDTGDQALLLYGLHRAKLPPSKTHPFGHGLELYFWSFVVALMIFALGGILAIYEGVEKIRHPQPIERAWVNFAVIGACFLFEGLSFRVAWREMRSRFATVPMWIALRRSKDPSTFAVLLEDGAALVGLAIALAGVTGSVVFAEERGDGIASVGIGCLLVTVAAFLASETRSLMAGENASPAFTAQLRDGLAAQPGITEVVDLKSLQLGPNDVLAVATVGLGRDLAAAQVGDVLEAARVEAQRTLPATRFLYLVPAPSGPVRDTTPPGSEA